ncbi:TetR/AcrR family transcriptional regulator [Compostimonas suwonensis]|uniref:AcrR family transcriptional regulator n=1 Tax=Compostimonas suwonensis TaxID=1048394 RepID=A0A2M9BU45_9MICO|nr:TetR/AcrR family transcriptional regulator [Compostimonas suwonensis]PJJ61463.1 AcrR family transcriptional regulator [Compostimonas suwonensis]
MSTTLEAPAKRPSEARERLLRTASELFYREGIHSVGVDRIVAEAQVTRATFYRHFPGKEELVQAYLEREDAGIRSMFAGAAPLASSPEQLLDLAIRGIADDVARNHTRGCPFINASAEYPDPQSPVRVTVREHRAWFHDTLETALVAAGRADAAEKARALVLLRDAALVGGYLDGASAITPTFVRTARTIAQLD